MEKALRLALDLNHPLQDCLYLALAQHLSTILITADQKFVHKAKEKYNQVKLLISSQ